MLRSILRYNYSFRVKEILSQIGVCEPCTQITKVIDILKKEPVIDNENAEQLIQMVSQLEVSKQMQMLDKVIVPHLQIKDKQIKQIEHMLQNNQHHFAISIYGKMNAFFNYSNPQLIAQFKNNFNIDGVDAEELSAICIGFGLIQIKDEQIWHQIIERSLLIKKDIHQHMRIATGVGLSNTGTEQFWLDFLNSFLSELQSIEQDVFTQSLQVLSQQEIIKLSVEHSSQIEQYIENNKFSNQNMTSIYASMARMQLGSCHFYDNLDIYNIQLFGDDLVQYVIDLLKVKQCLSNQTINSLVARAYSESSNPELLDLITLLIKQE